MGFVLCADLKFLLSAQKITIGPHKWFLEWGGGVGARLIPKQVVVFLLFENC
jgi:hypothetical protein